MDKNQNFKSIKITQDKQKHTTKPYRDIVRENSTTTITKTKPTRSVANCIEMSFQTFKHHSWFRRFGLNEASNYITQNTIERKHNSY